MEKPELQSILHSEKLPLTIYSDIVYNGIYRFIRIIEDNRAFLDFDREFDSDEGPARITFIFNSFDEMVCSIEKFIGKKLLEWKPISDEGFVINEDANWDELKKDFYNTKVQILSGYKQILIGDIYWRNLYNQKMSPDGRYTWM